MSARRRQGSEEQLAFRAQDEARDAEYERYLRRRDKSDDGRLAIFLEGVLCLYGELEGEIRRGYEDPEAALRKVAGVIDHTRLLRDRMVPDDGTAWEPRREEVRATLRLLARLALSTLDDADEPQQADAAEGGAL